MPIATLMNELLRSKYISWSGYDFNNSRPGQAGKKEVFSGGGPLLTFLFVREVYRLRVNSQWEAGKDLTVWVAPPPLLKQQFVNGCIYPLNSPSTRINNSEPSNSFSSSHSPLIWICLWKARPSPRFFFPFSLSLLVLGTCLPCSGLGEYFLGDLIGVTLLRGISLEQKSLARKDLITALSAAQLFALTLTLSPIYLLALPTDWDFQGFSLGHINRRPCIFSSGKQPFAPFPANRWCGKSPIWIFTVSAELILHTWYGWYSLGTLILRRENEKVLKCDFLQLLTFVKTHFGINFSSSILKWTLTFKYLVQRT